MPPTSRGFGHLTYAVESTLGNFFFFGVGGEFSELRKSYIGVEPKEKIAAVVTKTL